MVRVLTYQERAAKNPRRNGAGFSIAFTFQRENMKYAGNRLVYQMPALGRGSERLTATNAVVAYCPFCGHEYGKERK